MPSSALRHGEQHGQLTSVGITCALCHSTVDNSFAAGDRQAARRLGEYRSERRRDRVRCRRRSTTRPEGRVQRWGAGRVRSATSMRSTAPDLIALNSPSLPVVLPSDLRLEGRGLRDLQRRRSDLVLEQLRRGRRRWADTAASAIRASADRSRRQPDLVTPKLPALLDYQLSLRTPMPPEGSSIRDAAPSRQAAVPRRGRLRACHRPRPSRMS